MILQQNRINGSGILDIREHILEYVTCVVWITYTRIRGDILETNIGETAVHASIESIDVLLAVGAEAPGGPGLPGARWLSPMKQSSGKPCYYTLPAKNNILEMV